MKHEVYGIILANSSNCSLWPLSRELYPKYLFKPDNENTLFQSAFIRLVDLIDDKNIISITNLAQESIVRIQLENLRQKFCRRSRYKILTEQDDRNTISSLISSAKYILDNTKSKDAILVVIPADCVVKDAKNYVTALEEAIKLAVRNYVSVLCCSPQTTGNNLGYIKVKQSENIAKISACAFDAEEYKSNVSQATEKKYIKSKKYYSSMGILVAKASILLEKAEKFCLGEMPDTTWESLIMKNPEKVAAVTVDCGWNVFDNWADIYDVLPKDCNKNNIIGTVEQVNCKNSLFYSTSRLIAAVGVSDLAVVETSDAVLVCNRSKICDTTKIYEKLKKENNEVCVCHKTVYRPWGCYTVLDKGKGYLTKIIVVNPNQQLSLQRHRHRAEHWTVLEGKGKMILNNREFLFETGDSMDIKVMDIHSVKNPFKEKLKILEVQKGSILDENDIERLNDIYGRI